MASLPPFFGVMHTSTKDRLAQLIANVATLSLVS
jgi:hypothetical protein